jgi:hypothetical protein
MLVSPKVPTRGGYFLSRMTQTIFRLAPRETDVKDGLLFSIKIRKNIK